MFHGSIPIPRRTTMQTPLVPIERAIGAVKIDQERATLRAGDVKSMDH